MNAPRTIDAHADDRELLYLRWSNGRCVETNLTIAIAMSRLSRGQFRSRGAGELWAKLGDELQKRTKEREAQ